MDQVHQDPFDQTAQAEGRAGLDVCAPMTAGLESAAAALLQKHTMIDAWEAGLQEAIARLGVDYLLAEMLQGPVEAADIDQFIDKVAAAAKAFVREAYAGEVATIVARSHTLAARNGEYTRGEH